MRRTRTLASWSGLAVLAAALSIPLSAEAAPAEPEPSGTRADVEGGRGAGTAARGSGDRQAAVARRAAAAIVAGDPVEMPTSYPYQPELRLYRDNPDDAAKTAALLGHPDLAPQLTEWMGESNRISTQVVGQSTQGRDLYLVTVTAPEREEDTARQTAWREQIAADPVAAAQDAELLSQYKTPVWVTNNIHGNEWEGTDATMRYIDWLVSSPMAEVGGILRNNRLYFSLSLNPDGRTNATRATALGFDPNRDMITNSTPETRSYIRTAQALQPIYSADFHGYTSVLQMEPTGPPHGSNYEYDLYLPHNYALALKVEQDVVAANIPNNTYFNVVTRQVSATNSGPDTAHIKIPYRDTPSGWDDFPPIFTAQYSAFYGAATATVELPLTRGANGGTRQTPARAVVNTAVAEETVESLVEYMNTPSNAREMLLNQIETFRRGAAGEPKTQVTTANVNSIPGPTQWRELWDVVDDQEPVTLPRAYVIPVGEDQRSASDASRLVEMLVMHDIEVGTLTAESTIGGTTYPAGSYVVDMHQPLRGLANSLLDLGEDISPKLPSMYDISAWSWSYLWGATVDKAGLTTDGPIGATEPVTAPDPVAAMPAEGYLTFDVAGVRDFAAVNSLLEDGVPVSMLEDGSVVVSSEDRDAVAATSEEFDIAVSEASEEDLDALDDESTKGLSDLTVAYVGTQDDRVSLQELGFDDLVAVTVTGLNAGAADANDSVRTGLEDADLLWVGTSLRNGGTNQNPIPPTAPAQAAVQAFVDDGHSLLGRTNSAFNAALDYGLVPSTSAVVSGNGSGNGIVDVDTPEGSVLAPYAQDSSFVYPAYWFSVPSDVEVEQTYGADPLLAGHWRPGTSQGNPLPNGPDDAANQPSVISNEVASGARTVVFGTSVLFRNHPKGGLSQAARALHWAGPEGERVVAPDAPEAATTVTTMTATSPVTYPADVVADVTVSSEAGTPTGEVAILDADENEVARADLVAGEATVRVEGLRPGRGRLSAVYVPDSEAFQASSSDAVPVQVLRATSAVTVRRTGTEGRRVTFAVTLTIPQLDSVGTVRIADKGRVLRTLQFGGRTQTRTVTLSLARGSHVIRAVFAGTELARGSKSNAVSFTLR